MKRRIIYSILGIALALRWIYPVWIIVSGDRRLDAIMAHPFWMRPAVYDAGVVIDFWLTAFHTLLLIAIAMLLSRYPSRSRPKR